MIVAVAVPTPLRRLFDYLLPETCEPGEVTPGMRVRVPFGNRDMVGLVVELKDSSDQAIDKLKPIKEIIDQAPLVAHDLLSLFLWAANYYQHPVGDALFSSLPTLLRQGESIPTNRQELWRLTTHGLGLSEKSLSRAKKQQQLIQLLRDQGPMSAQQAIAQGANRQIFNALAEKGLVEKWLAETPEETTAIKVPLLASPPLALREEQRVALDSIRLDQFFPSLLFGDTGTGKTEVYLQAIDKVLGAGRQALVLVPEINLTPQTIERFRKRFSCVIAAIHSQLSDRERLQAWTDARDGRAKIIIGTRSAVFTPMADLGIIVVDEEHDPSFKQQEGFRYSARDVAVMRANREGIPLILGSATPSLETLYNCRNGRYRSLELRERSGGIPPVWQLVDLKGTQLRGGLTATALSAIKEHLGQGNQVLVFLNRRGYAPALLCHDCGWQANCNHCAAKLTAHLKQGRLVCHHCEWQQPIPTRCPDCGRRHLVFSGHGTERCEETLTTLFPDIPVIRIDRDSTRRKGSMDRALEQVKTNEPCILIGTQMLAKGHHFPAVSLAVMLDVDGGLFSTDFRAIERTAQMIIQVAGRAGRGDTPGSICLQSHCCDHPLIRDIVSGDYRRFAESTLRERELNSMPPFSHLALFRADCQDPEHCQGFLRAVRSHAEAIMAPDRGIGYLGPLPAAMEKRRGLFRFTLLIKAANRSQLATGLTELCRAIENIPARQIKWSLDIDPQETTM